MTSLAMRLAVMTALSAACEMDREALNLAGSWRADAGLCTYSLTFDALGNYEATKDCLGEAPVTEAGVLIGDRGFLVLSPDADGCQTAVWTTYDSVRGDRLLLGGTTYEMGEALPEGEPGCWFGSVNDSERVVR